MSGVVAYALLLGCGVEPVPTEADDACLRGDTLPTSEPVESTGVVIVGAGLAGMAAAYEAQVAGTPYLLLDRGTAVGGSSQWAGGQMLFAGTPEQEALGIVDSPEQLLSEWGDITGGDPDLPWVQAYVQNAVPEVHDWLLELGTTFSIRTTNPDEGSLHRLHQPDGNGVGLAATVADQLDPSRQRLGRNVTQILCHQGRVRGVRVEAEGAEEWIAADAVVMATGGFLRDLDRVLAARPELTGVELWHASSPLSDGNGLDLIADVGGTFDNLAAVGVYAHGTDDYRRAGDHEELGLGGVEETLWVDAEGAPFFDESLAKSFLAGEAVVSRTGGVAWMLWDADLVGQLTLGDSLMEPSDSKLPTSFDAAVAAGGTAFAADSLAELAAALAIPGPTLEASAAGLDHPPYYGFRLVPSLAKGFGGVAVGLDGAVVDDTGRPIEGLYAAGELTGMAGGSLVGNTGFSGSLSAVIYSGRVAGRSAALASPSR